ncbi:hypothetical protein NXV08_12845 [Bacteroides fragilis]|nr:hypothetical protein [Bacteroides fragilis]MCS2667943.1 hypothetical protein [Bacteroides fragilis]MCS2739517.1 hypothetical protein [Bacteroides fragilis]MCS3275626.1 hypothetical protein [Bacteroides fragilis]
MSDDKSQLTISIDIKAEDRKYQIVENSVTSILFKVSDTTTRYVYNIRMGEMRNESETTPEGLKNLNLKKECDLSVKIRTEADQAFVLSEKHCGNIMLVEFFKYEGIPVLCASCVLIVKPSDLKITQVIFKDSTGKEVGCGSVQYEANLKFALRVKYNRPLLRGKKLLNSNVKVIALMPSQASMKKYPSSELMKMEHIPILSIVMTDCRKAMRVQTMYLVLESITLMDLLS